MFAFTQRLRKFLAHVKGEQSISVERKTPLPSYMNIHMHTHTQENGQHLTENNQMLKVLEITPVHTAEYGFKTQVPTKDNLSLKI